MCKSVISGPQNQRLCHVTATRNVLMTLLNENYLGQYCCI